MKQFLVLKIQLDATFGLSLIFWSFSPPSLPWSPLRGDRGGLSLGFTYLPFLGFLCRNPGDLFKCLWPYTSSLCFQLIDLWNTTSTQCYIVTLSLCYITSPLWGLSMNSEPKHCESQKAKAAVCQSFTRPVSYMDGTGVCQHALVCRSNVRHTKQPIYLSIYRSIYI